MRIDIMTDIETLGTSVDSTIFQISALAFDITTGAELSIFDRVADIAKNDSFDMTVSGSTLKWWMNTDKELFARLLNQGMGSSSEMLVEFHTWLTGMGAVGELHLWGNGILFDNNILRSQLEREGLDYPIKYNKDRDVRTIVDIASTKLGITENQLKEKYYDSRLTAHDALNDVTNQTKLVVGCYRELAL